MLSRLPLLKIVRLWAAILLATIGLQATAPAALAIEPRHGSAFSATTVEVALVSPRAQHAVRSVLPISPLPVFLPVMADIAYAVAARPEPALRGHLPRGPPAIPLLARGPAPRAPPID